MASLMAIGRLQTNDLLIQLKIFRHKFSEFPLLQISKFRILLNTTKIKREELKTNQLLLLGPLIVYCT